MRPRIPATTTIAGFATSAGKVDGSADAVSLPWRYLRAVLPKRRRLHEPSPTNPDRESTDTDPGLMADHRLLRAFLRHTPGSDDELAGRLSIVPRILGSLCRRFGFQLPSQDLEDIAQDAVAIALRKLDQIKPDVPLDAWLHRLCNYEFSNALRRRRRQRTESLPDQVVDPTEAAMRQLERNEVLLQGLEQLRPIEAAIVRLHQLQGLTLAEVGQRLAMTENSVKGRYYRAIEQLTAILSRHRPGTEES